MDGHDGGESSKRNTTRTDLSLLLECLKFQMKCPDQQKQALLAILSICEKREHNVELLREIGGVAFLLNLSKSCVVQSDVKETVLFTLGTLAEASVYCKNWLCRKEIFTDLANWLVKEDAPLSKKRVIVYFLSVLVANNKLGQMLAQNTSCLDILLNLFKATFPLSAEGIFKTANTTQLHQLWSAISGALSGCVNNPHNEEGQRACVTVFPTVKNWIQQISLPQTNILQPICSFIAMTVANNPCVQESFAASGGLENLTLALIRFCLGSETSLVACQLAVSTSKTLSACISDNRAAASELAKYDVVCHLFSLLINPKLESEERLSVLLTMGHCTEAAEEHQRQLVQIGGLPVIITLLTEDSSEEVRKAATYILQTCKEATNTLGITDKETNVTGKDVFIEPSPNFNSYKRSAKDLLQRINQLEGKQTEAELAYPPTITQKSSQLPAPRLSPEEKGSLSLELPLFVRVKRDTTNMKRSRQEQKCNVGGENVLWPPFNRAKAMQSVSYDWRLEGAREPSDKSVSVLQDAPKHIYSLGDDVNNEADNPGEQGSVSDVRCTGCMLRFDEVNSRMFASLQSSHSCDMHKVLKEATESYMSQHRRLFTQQQRPSSTIQQLTEPDSSTVPYAKSQKNQKNWRDYRLTPLHKGMKTLGPAFCQRLAPIFNPIKRPHPPGTENAENKRKLSPDGKVEAETSSIGNSQRRKRQDFSREEELYLLCGVKTYGPSWNTILWSYPFQHGRTNVDLAKKYSRLMKNKAKDELA